MQYLTSKQLLWPLNKNGDYAVGELGRSWFRQQGVADAQLVREVGTKLRLIPSKAKRFTAAAGDSPMIASEAIQTLLQVMIHASPAGERFGRRGRFDWPGITQVIRKRGNYVPVEWQSTVEELRTISTRMLRLAIFGAVLLFGVTTGAALFLQVWFGWPGLITLIGLAAGVVLGLVAALLVIARTALAWWGLWRELGIGGQ